MIERTFIQKSFNKLELEEYLSKKLDRAGFSHLEIIKTPLVTRIVLHVAKPGLAIGKGGSTIKLLTDVIAKKYKIDNPQIEIQEIKHPNLNAKILAERMASMIQREFSWRSIAYKLVKDVIDAGAQGVELVVKGKLSGKGGRKKKVRIAHGYMKKLGAQTKWVDFAKAAAYPKAGAIGIRLSIIHPEIIFPDKVDVKKVLLGLKKAELEAKEQAQAPKQEETKQADIVKEGKEKEETTKTEKGKEFAGKAKEEMNKVEMKIDSIEVKAQMPKIDGVKTEAVKIEKKNEHEHKIAPEKEVKKEVHK
ncbi:MAG: 30S ribosomal protein S3 [Candidatus Diapherotrites archaeon]|nr:30S ribosomal protein S3 [Candidatus Diapherotrites archaeon]